MSLRKEFSTVVLLLIGILFTFNSVIGQAVNDTCTAPIDLVIPATSPYEACQSFTGNLATGTVDLPGLCSGNNDLWYTFTATGPNAIIEVTGTTATPCITVGQWDAGDCTSTLIANSGNSPYLIQDGLTTTQLTLGQTYYVVISFDNNNVNSFDLCIQNPPEPANNERCAPTTLSPGTCLDATTFGAGALTVLPCIFGPDLVSTVWFEVTLTPPSNNILEIELSGTTGQIAVGLYSSVDCTATDFLYENCSDGSAPIIFENPVGQVPNILPGETYLVSVSSLQENWSDFNICIEESFIPPCAANINCDNALAISVDGDSPEICSAYCNANMPAFLEFDPATCFSLPNGAAWFSFTTGNQSSQLSIDITSIDMSAPQVAVFSGPCTGLVAENMPQGCSIGANNQVSLSGLNLPLNQTIYIVVSDGGGLGGDFDMCTFREITDQICVGNDQRLEVVSRTSESGVSSEPLTGPYCPGDQVGFCYTVDRFDVTSSTCQWLHGIIPTFGEGWDIGVNENPGGNVPALYGGNWIWYNQGAITYKISGGNPKFKLFTDCDGKLGLCKSIDSDCMGTPITQGDGMPAGWYSYHPNAPAPGGGNGPNGPTANDTWGDGDDCTTADGPWTVCFTLTVKTSMDICENSACAPDLSVSVMTTADGETGGYVNSTSACKDDPNIIFNGQLNCNGGPDIMATYVEPICSGQSVNIELSASESSNFSWTASALGGGLSGYSAGSGNRITDFVSNTSNDIGVIEYHIFANPLAGCPADTMITIAILPEVVADAGPDTEGCANVCLLGIPFQLGPTPTNADWTYEWTGDAVSDATIPNPTACPNSTTTYTLTVTNSQGCSSSDQVLIEILPALTPSILGPDEVCLGDEFMLIVDYGYGSSYNFGVAFEWYLRDVNGIESYYTYTPDPELSLSLSQIGLYEFRVEVTDLNNCMTEAITQVNVSVSPMINVTPDQPQICAGASVDLTIDLLNEFDINSPEYIWADPAGDTTFSDVIVATMIGDYFYRVYDDITGCDTSGYITVSGVAGITPMDAPLFACDEGGNMAAFNLMANQININPDPSITFTWFLDSGATIPVPNITNHVSSSGSVWVVLAQGSCTNLPFEVVLTVQNAASITFMNVNSPYCILDNAVQFTATPPGGQYSGPAGLTVSGSFDPALAGLGNHMIYYEVTSAMGCAGQDSIQVNVTGSQSPTLGATPNPICLTHAPITVTTDLSPGIFTGSGITDGVTGVFDPSLAGPGQHWVTFTSSMTCTEADSIQINVLDTIMPPIVSCGASGSDFVTFNWAHASSTDFIVSTYIGGIIQDNMVAVSGTTHTVNGLMANQSVTIEIIAVGTGLCGNSSAVSLDCSSAPCPVVPIDMPDLPAVCVTSGQVQFSASPTGGQYSGANGVLVDANTGVLTASVAGVGTHTVYYDLSTPGGCTYRDSAMVTIEDVLPTPNVYCTGVSLDSVSFSWDPVPGVTNYIINTFINGMADEVGLNLSTNTYSRNGLNEGDLVTMEVVFVGTNTCGNSAIGFSDPDCTTQNCVDNPPVIDPVSTLCQSSTAITLSATPSGGNFGGPGVTNGMFDPTVVGPGSHQISYVYIDDIGCSQSQTANILVEAELEEPIVMCGTTSPNSVEITWSHPDPSVTTYEISYQINGGPVMMDVTSNLSITISPLVQGDSISMEVVAQGVNNCGNSQAGVQSCIAEDCPTNSIDFEGNILDFCVSGSDLYQILAAPSGGTFSSTSLGVGVNGVFDAAAAGVGSHVINYMVMVGSCPYSGEITLNVEDVVVPPTVTCVDQTLDAVIFDWIGLDGVTYIVYYSVNGGALQGPFTTLEETYTVSGLTELDEVTLYVEIQNTGPCGNSEPDDDTCIALNCDIVITNLPLTDVVLCDTDTIPIEPIIMGSGSEYIYEWTTPSGIEMTKDIMASAAGDYTLSVTDERLCMGSASFTLQQDAIEAFLSTSDPSCFGNEDGFIRIDDISGGTSPYQISFNGGSYGSSREFTGLSAADYTIDILDANGCTWSEEFLISEPDEFLFSIDTTLIVMFGDSLIYDVEVDSRTDSLVTYKVWLTSDPNVECLDCWTLISVPTFTSSYVLNVETSNGCDGNGIIRSLIIHDRTVFIPNVFRPNSTNEDNQIFQIFTSDEVEMVESFQVYNRWGDRMFGIDNPYNPHIERIGWDGNFRGTLGATGVYVYWVTVRYTDGTTKFFNGDVTLLR